MHSKQSGLTIWVEMNYVTLTWAKKTNYCGSVDKEASSIKLWRLGSFQIRQSKGPFPLVDLFLIFEKSSCKNQIRQTGFLAWKNRFQNWFLQAKSPVCRTWFLQLDFQKSSTDQQEEWPFWLPNLKIP